MEYPIKKVNQDFEFTPEIIVKGTRKKRIAYDKKEHRKAIFKYEEYNCTEACSEKIAYEIARILQYPAAKIELAQDEYGTLGILNYLFVDTKNAQHIDAIAYIKKDEAREQFYTIENIKECLDRIDSKLFEQFLRILIFDALIGETDRHEENWGILIENGKYKISPLYDNGCNLLREFKNVDFAEKYYSGKRNFNTYIERSKSLIYNQDTQKTYTHFQLIEKLYNEYPEKIKSEVKSLEKLTDNQIEQIVNRIPKHLMKEKQKEYIIKFIKIRKQKLKEIINKGMNI